MIKLPLPEIRLILKNVSGPLPTSTFSLIANGQTVGMIQIRHRPSRSEPVPPGFESHVYYEINPEHRGQGYGRTILKLGLAEAQKLGLKELSVTCYATNPASRRIIETNGGVLIDSCIIPEYREKGTFLKFRIGLE